MKFRRYILSAALALLAYSSSARAGTLSDASGTITTGGTSQVALADNSSGGKPRKYLIIQNVESVDVEWVNFGGAATQANGSFKILPGASLVFEHAFIADQSVNIIGPTTGDKFTIKYR